jgi:hypothetical protein
MKHELVKELLDLIVSFDRSPFPDGAVDAWFLALDGVDYRDARQAVMEHYGSLGARDKTGAVRRIVPADVRSRAAALREARERELNRHRPTLPAGRVGSTGRPGAVEEMLRQARAKIAQRETDRAEYVRRQMRPERIAA